MTSEEDSGDIREIISLEEDLELPVEQADLEGEEEQKPSKYLSEGQIKDRLDELKGKVPSFVVKEIRDNVSSRNVTRDQLENIIERVITAYLKRKDMGSAEGISNLIQNLTEKLDTMAEEIKSVKLGSNGHDNGKGGHPIMEEHNGEGNNNIDKVENENGSDLGDFSSLGPEQFLFSAGNPNGARLKDIPEDVFSVMLSMKWLEFIVEKVGVTHLGDILEFYNDMGWISDKVLDKLIKFSRGTRPFHQEVDWKPEEKLTARDHLLSLLFVERLRGKKVSKDMLIQLDRELKKIKAGAEEIYGI